MLLSVPGEERVCQIVWEGAALDQEAKILTTEGTTFFKKLIDCLNSSARSQEGGSPVKDATLRGQKLHWVLQGVFLVKALISLGEDCLSLSNLIPVRIFIKIWVFSVSKLELIS